MAEHVDTKIPAKILVEMRAFVFRLELGTEVWTPVQIKNVYSRVQLLCMTHKPGSVSLYRVFGKLESNGSVTIDIQLHGTITYQVLEPNWHQIRTETKAVFGLRVSPDSDGGNFAVVVQNILRSLQGSPAVATPPVRPVRPTPPAWAEHAPKQQTVLSKSGLSESKRENARALSKREHDANIDKQCLLLHQAIFSGDKKKAEELACELASRKLNLSIKLKNPVFVTVDQLSESNTDDKQDTNSIIVKVIVEDEESAGGSFSMKVEPNTTTLYRLKEEVCDRYGLPEKVQRWIIGKRLPKDNATLQEMGVVQSGTTLFLYLLSGRKVGLKRSEFFRAIQRASGTRSGEFLVTGRTSRTKDAPIASLRDQLTETTIKDASAVTTDTQLRISDFDNFANVHLEQPSQDPNDVLNQEHTIQHGSSNFTQPQGFDRRTTGILDLQRLILNQEQTVQGQDGRIDGSMSLPVLTTGNSSSSATAQVETQIHCLSSNDTIDVNSLGWQCPSCTYVNIPTRPGCEQCGTSRPESYVVPKQFVLDERERLRIEEERKQDQLFRQREEQQRKQAQEEREINFRNLLQTAQQPLAPNTDEFDCLICYTEVEPGDGVVLRECLHSFCKDCLREHIRNSTEPEVQCPYKDEVVECHAIITAQEVKALLSTEDFNKFLNRSLATAESQEANSFHCKTPNCPGWCIYEDNQNSFLCPVCKSVNCLTCKAIHPMMNCREYQDDLKRRALNDDAARQTQQYLEDMVAKGDAMHCPQCQIILLKKDGCDWMRCSMCRTEICWATRGRRWGPDGVGDISGGCRCRIGGKKCHPKCRNCH